MDFSNAYSCFATDVITEYPSPHSESMLGFPGFAAGYSRVLRDSAKIATWHLHIPSIFPIPKAVPRWVMAKLDSGPSLAVSDTKKVGCFTL